jgi:hypothetical protein
VTVKASVVSAFAAGRADDATALVFEYMAATRAETGQAVPGGIASCPPCSTRECATCQPFTARRGALLIAGHGRQLAGCADLAMRPAA